MNQVNWSIVTTYQVFSMRLVFQIFLRSKKLIPNNTVFLNRLLPNRMSHRVLMTRPIKEKRYANNTKTTKIHTGCYLQIVKKLQELPTFRPMNLIKTTTITRKNPTNDQSSFNQPHRLPKKTNES
jgi:hypothetical protein